MKAFLLAGLLLTSSFSAHAVGLSILDANAVNFNNYDGQPATYTGQRNTGFTGIINALTDGILQVVYLGKESANENIFRFEDDELLTGASSPGDSIFVEVNEGIVDFRFRELSNNEQYKNGESFDFAIISGLFPDEIEGDFFGPFDYILGLNDGSGDNDDYDDFVVGLRFQPEVSEVSEVPVPAALPLMATALGLFGLSRRKL